MLLKVARLFNPRDFKPYFKVVEWLNNNILDEHTF